MAGPLQVALPTAPRSEWVAARVEAAAPFTVAAASSLLLAIDDGGYLATTWGWAALTLAWVAGLGLLLREGRVSRLELGWIGGLTALTAWTAASMLWTTTQTETALEVERTFVYLLAAIAVSAVTRSLAYRGLLWGTWAGSTIACLYALATRLFPERLGVTDPVAGYRLSDPIGYWNGLGLLAAVAALLAVGLATYGRRGWERVVAAAVVPLLLSTLYFTFSRGAWLALAAGLLVAFVVSSRRLQLAASLLVQAVPAGAAVWLAYRAKPLRETTASLAAATHAGHTLAWRLLLVVAAAAVLKIGYDAIANRRAIPGRYPPRIRSPSSCGCNRRSRGNGSPLRRADGSGRPSATARSKAIRPPPEAISANGSSPSRATAACTSGTLRSTNGARIRCSERAPGAMSSSGQPPDPTSHS